jgi:hypothetical protein
MRAVVAVAQMRQALQPQELAAVARAATQPAEMAQQEQPIPEAVVAVEAAHLEPKMAVMAARVS